jgi:ferredoxin/menaquinone-dependent protoporphyrinogen IX oxidase
MKINSLGLVCFSPTGTTKKVLSVIAEGIGAKKTEYVNLMNDVELADYNAEQYDLTIIGVPTYASRIPPEATEKLNKLCGKNTPVVLVAVYGNNKFGDVLIELKNITAANEFVPIFAGAFIGEHSFSTIDKPIAHGRPDQEDLNQALEFGKQIKINMLNNSPLALSNKFTVPGDFPYREWNKIPAAPPLSDASLCTLCGKCITSCPVNAITVTDEVVTDSISCIYCCACVKVCSSDARVIADSTILGAQERLYNNCSERKEPEFFI